MSQIQTGQAIRLSMFNPRTGKPQTVGIFNDCSIQYSYGASPIYILGRTGPAMIQFTHQEPVTVRMRAWRIDDHGPFVDAMLPPLQDLLTNPTTQLTLISRELEAAGRDGTIAEISGLVITGFDQTTSIRNTVEYTVSGMGTLLRDESQANAEAPGATQLP